AAVELLGRGDRVASRWERSEEPRASHRVLEHKVMPRLAHDAQPRIRQISAGALRQGGDPQAVAPALGVKILHLGLPDAARHIDDASFGRSAIERPSGWSEQRK